MTSAERVGAHYDTYHHLYRQVWGEQLHHGLWRTGRETQREAVEALTRRVAEVADLRAGLKVYDVGCGYGAVSRWLAREFGVEVIGVTCSEAQFVECEQQTPPGVRFHCADWLAMEVEPFDRVIALECVEHVEEKAAFFAKCAQALSKNGRLLVAGWLAGRPSARLDSLCARDPIPSLWSALQYREAAEAAGFEMEEQIDLTQETAPTWPCYARRFVRKAWRDPRLFRFVAGGRGGTAWLPLTFWRIVSAFRDGSLRYGILTARRRDRPVSVCATRT